MDARRVQSVAQLPSTRHGPQGAVLRIFLSVVERCLNDRYGEKF
jgi:hypothetical protein